MSSKLIICDTLPLIVHSSSRNQSPSLEVKSLRRSRAAGMEGGGGEGVREGGREGRGEREEGDGEGVREEGEGIRGRREG